MTDVNQNFFALGGHSLGAVRVVHGLRARLGVDLPVWDVFEHPTPAGLVRLLAKGGDVHVVQPLREQRRTGDVRPSPGQVLLQ